MSKKWLEREGPKWVEKAIVSDEQLQQIRALYMQKGSGVALLPLLASVLIALSILTFIAANWELLIPELRIIIVLLAMTAFYAFGYHQWRKKQTKLGIGLIGLGLICFGGSLLILGQTFHLVTYHVATFIIWGVVGVVLTFLFQSRFLYLITLLICHVAQIYSISTLNQFSFFVLILLLIPLGFYWQRDRQPVLTWLYTASIVAQSVMFIAHEDLSQFWMVVVFVTLYALAELHTDREVRQPIQVIVQLGVIIIAFTLVFSIDEGYYSYRLSEWAGQWTLLAPLVLAIVFAIYLKQVNGRQKQSWFELLLFLPLIYLEFGYPWLQFNVADIGYLLILLAYSILLLLRGYDEQSRWQVNLGTALFLFTCFVAYTKYTWAFLDKSVFFLIGGIILFALSWYLNQRRKKAFAQAEGGEPRG